MRYTACILGIVAALGISSMGCIKTDAIKSGSPFEESELDAILSITLDMSGSFHDTWDQRAHSMFIEICDRYFKESMGANSKLVISQLSGKTDQVILFEGRPADLRKRFKAPEELAAYLKSRSDASASHVLEASRRTLDYIGSTSGRSKRTRVMALIFSDMCESETDPKKLGALEDALMASLKEHRSRNGAIGLYFVSEHEREKWYSRLRDAGYETSHYVVEGELSASPQLPTFE